MTISDVRTNRPMKLLTNDERMEMLFFFFVFFFFVDACARHTTFYPAIFWSCPYYSRNQPQGITQSTNTYLMITRRLLSLNVLEICLCLNQPTEKKSSCKFDAEIHASSAALVDWERA